MRGGLLLVAVGLLVAGCAQKADVASDGGSNVTTPPPITTAPITTAPITTAPLTGPTFVPPNGICAVELIAPPPQTAAPQTTSTPTTRQTPPGDSPPNHGDNRAWRQRKPLAPEAHARGMALAEQVKPGLSQLCDAGNFAMEPTRAVFTAAGAPNTSVRPIDAGYGQVPPPGVVFTDATTDAFGAVCVMGDLLPGTEFAPGKVRVFVQGPIREGSCDEPKSH